MRQDMIVIYIHNNGGIFAISAVQPFGANFEQMMTIGILIDLAVNLYTQLHVRRICVEGNSTLNRIGNKISDNDFFGEVTGEVEMCEEVHVVLIFFERFNTFLCKPILGQVSET
jgi:hypothetical protein